MNGASVSSLDHLTDVIETQLQDGMIVRPFLKKQ
jgi:hypothetical protein